MIMYLFFKSKICLYCGKPSNSDICRDCMGLDIY